MLRRAAAIALGAGAAGSAALFLRAGLHAPWILLLVMAVWTFTPFVTMAAAMVWSKPWPAGVQSTLYVATLLLTLGALTAYVYDWLHPRPQAAFMYVMVPPASVTALTVALLIAAWSSRTARTK